MLPIVRPPQLLVPDRRLLVPDASSLVKGRIQGQIIREGRMIDEWDVPNIVVNQGLNYLLGAALGAQSVTTVWYIGLFSNNYTILASDTAANIAASSGEVTQYTAGIRQTWSPAVPSAQAITNSASQASYTFNASLSVYGAFLISSSAINGTSGILFSGAQFGSSKAVVSSDILQLTYTFTAASA